MEQNQQQNERPETVTATPSTPDGQLGNGLSKTFPLEKWAMRQARKMNLNEPHVPVNDETKAERQKLLDQQLILAKSKNRAPEIALHKAQRKELSQQIGLIAMKMGIQFIHLREQDAYTRGEMEEMLEFGPGPKLLTMGELRDRDAFPKATGGATLAYHLRVEANGRLSARVAFAFCHKDKDGSGDSFDCLMGRKYSLERLLSTEVIFLEKENQEITWSKWMPVVRFPFDSYLLSDWVEDYEQTVLQPIFRERAKEKVKEEKAKVKITKESPNS